MKKNCYPLPYEGLDCDELVCSLQILQNRIGIMTVRTWFLLVRYSIGLEIEISVDAAMIEYIP